MVDEPNAMVTPNVGVLESGGRDADCNDTRARGVVAEGTALMGYGDSYPQAATTAMDSPRNLACPFFKHSPKKFQNQRTCVGPEFKSIHRMKEHLYRKHAPHRYTCNRCLLPFRAISDLQKHQRALNACAVAPDRKLVGEMTTEQLGKIKSRQRSKPGMTEEEKWFEIYWTLFPGASLDPVLSPYYEHGSDRATAATPEGCDCSAFSLHDFEEFLGSGLPLDLEQSFASEVRAVIPYHFGLENTVGDIVIAVREIILPKLLQSYKQRISSQHVDEGGSDIAAQRQC